MARKGLSTTLVLIVTIVVLLVVALVLLTVFGGVVSNFATFGEAKAQCGLFFSWSCSTTATGCTGAPSTWGAQLLKVDNVPQSCGQLCGDWGSKACTKPSGGTTCTFTCI